MKRECQSLNKLAELCLNIANLVDREGESGDYNSSIDKLGLGYRALSSYLREGVKDIITIQSNISVEREKRVNSESEVIEMREFVSDIFGINEVYSWI